MAKHFFYIHMKEIDEILIKYLVRKILINLFLYVISIKYIKIYQKTSKNILINEIFISQIYIIIVILTYLNSEILCDSLLIFFLLNLVSRH